MNAIGIFLLILGIVLLIVAFKVWRNYKLLRSVSRDSLIVFGKKGHGKTLLFSVLARMERKRKGYASVFPMYQPNEKLITYDVVNVSPNTWENVLNNDVVKIRKDPDLEGVPLFLDDAGIYLPNFADSQLKKAYPSMPIAFAVWRHLYNAPIHINSQDVSRCWKMIREQADGFLKARRTIKIGPIFLLFFSYFDRVQSAEEDLAPMKKPLLMKGDKSRYQEYSALHGTIKDGFIIGISRHHRYDSRYLHGTFFGTPFGQDPAPDGGECLAPASEGSPTEATGVGGSATLGDGTASDPAPDQGPDLSSGPSPL